jgi:hypothetical protein
MSLSTNLIKFKPIDPLAFFFNLLLFVASLSLLFIHKNLPNLVPLWYSKFWGESRLGKSEFLWLFPIFIACVLLINNTAAKLLVKDHAIIAKILVWTAFFISLILFYAFYKIVLLVV